MEKSVGVKSQEAFVLTDDLVAVAKEAALQYGVSSAICAEDQLLGYLVSNLSGGVEAVKVYINDGDPHAEKICKLIDSLRLPNSSKILEFAAGFGRISRHLVKKRPDLNLIACDIHLDAVDFLRDRLNIESLISSSKPEDLDVGIGYQLIFAVSFFSHLPEKNFGRWLVALYNSLAPGGYLMFTTHGESAVKLNPDIWNSMPEGPSAGHRFAPFSDQLDLDQSEYGTSLALPIFVLKMFKEFIPDSILIRQSTAEWFEIQDEWIVQKPR